MALPKTFSSGERLFASDLNSNFEDLDTRLGTIDLEDLANVGGTPTDGQILEYDTGTSSWGPVAKPEGGLVAVKHAIKTDTTVQGGLGESASFDVPGLSLTHAMSNASNKLIISGFFGAASAAGIYAMGVGIAVTVDGSFIYIGNSASQRTRVTAGAQLSGYDQTAQNLAFTYVYAPGDTSSHTYKIRARNISFTTQTLYINRSPEDGNNGDRSRTASGFVIQEVSV